MRRLSRYFDAHPLRAVIAGLVVAFLLMYFAAPAAVERADQPSYSKGAV